MAQNCSVRSLPKGDSAKSLLKGNTAFFQAHLGTNDVLGDYARSGTYERGTNSAIFAFFKDKTGTYFDIGANIGLTCIPLAKRTQVDCYVFEPDPTNFANLSSNVLQNDVCERIEALNFALFDQNTLLEFEVCDSNPGDNRVRLNGIQPGLLFEQHRKTISVSAKCLDDLSFKIKHPFLVKMDVQGAEPFAISGGEKTLSQADGMIIEWSPYLIKRMGGDPDIVLEFLRRNFLTAKIDNISEDWGASLIPIAEVCDRLASDFQRWSDGFGNYVNIAAAKG